MLLTGSIDGRRNLSYSLPMQINPIEVSRPLPSVTLSSWADPFPEDADRARRKGFLMLEVWFTRIAREKIPSKDARAIFRDVCARAFQWLLQQDRDWWRRYAVAGTPQALFAVVYYSDGLTRAGMHDLFSCLGVTYGLGRRN